MSAKKIGYPLLLIALIFSAFVSNSGPIDKVIALLSQFNQTFPQEKIHIQTDKNQYLAGDTMYFKAYVVLAGSNAPSDQSKILYVNLSKNSGGEATTFTYPIENGVGSGSFELPDSLSTGSYALTAHTGWMQNFDEAFYYRSNILIRGMGSKTPPSDKKPSYNLQFFPEGGAMVAQQTSVIGFKAVNSRGLGEEVSGTVFDESGNAVATFKSAFAGMGRFSLKAIAGQHYKATFKTADGSTQTVPLPEVARSGYTLAVTGMDKTDITVTVNHTGPTIAGAFSILAQSANKLISSTQVDLAQNSATIKIPVKDFPNGIAQLTLFDPSAQPLAERLVFINKRNHLRVRLTEPGGTSKQDERKLSLEVTDELSNPVSGDFSLAVTQQEQPTAGFKSPSILADLLLTSDLKGNIENPDHYFGNDDATLPLQLDNLMLTQGWRRFTWKDLIQGNNPQIIYPMQQTQTLSGSLRSKAGKNIAGGKVILTCEGANAFTLTANTDNSGRFNFNLPVLTGSKQFKLIGSDAAGKTDVQVILDQKPAVSGIPTTVPPAFDAAILSAQNNAIAQSAGQQNGAATNRQLKEVLVQSKKVSAKEKALQPSANLNGAGNADQVITYKELSNCANLDQCLQGKLTGVIFKSVLDPVSKIEKKVAFSTSGMNKPMLIVIDGVPVSGNETSINNIPAVDVQVIEVLRSGSKLVAYGMEASGGVLLITTKRGGIDYYQVNAAQKGSGAQVSGLLSVSYNGYHINREFYVPAFGTANRKTVGVKTILWNPAIHTDEDGKAVISIYPQPNTNKIEVTIEGISADGKIGYLNQQLILKN